MGEVLYPDESYAIMGAAFEVYEKMGCGFLESVYHESLDIELQSRTIPAQKEIRLPLSYKGIQLKQHYVADFICYDKIVVEIKVVSKLQLGILINFGHYPKVEYKRLALTKQTAKEGIV